MVNSLLAVYTCSGRGGRVAIYTVLSFNCVYDLVKGNSKLYYYV